MARYRRNPEPVRPGVPPFEKGDILIPEGAIYPEGAVEVDGIDERSGDVLAHPLGGGFRLRFPPEAWQQKYRFRKVSAYEQKMRHWRRGKVTIDVAEGVAEPEFEVWTDGSKWNGWERPQFDREAADKFIEWYNEAAETVGDRTTAALAEDYGNGHFAWFNEPTHEVVTIDLSASTYIGVLRDLQEVAEASPPRSWEGSAEEWRARAQKQLESRLDEVIHRWPVQTIMLQDGTTIDVWGIYDGYWTWQEPPVEPEPEYLEDAFDLPPYPDQPYVGQGG